MKIVWKIVFFPGKKIFPQGKIVKEPVIENITKGFVLFAKKFEADIVPVGICGFDDWGWASLIPPGITTITQDSYSTGVMSAQLLIKRINKGNTGKRKYVELPTELIIRGSTTPSN